MKPKSSPDLITASCLTAGLMGWLLVSAVATEPARSTAPADPPAAEEAEAESADATSPAPPVDPKPLSASARRGLAWLVDHQHDDGGWGQGEESRQMQGRLPRPRPTPEPGRPSARPVPVPGGDAEPAALIESPSNVGDTAMAALALLRGTMEADLLETAAAAQPAPEAGNAAPDTEATADPEAGTEPSAEPLTDEEIDSWRKSVRRGARFICTHIEQADDESLAITDLRGTRLQQKIGAYVDTFLAALFLTEYRQTLSGSDEDYDRVSDALDKVMAKIQDHQQEDGSWAAGGWAGDLSLSVAGKAVNRAAQSGIEVKPEVLERVAASGNADFDRGNRAFRVGRSAGIELYAASKSVAQLQDTANTFGAERAQVERQLETAATDQDREMARARLSTIEENDANLREARGEVVQRLRNDEQFVAGFGTNGGEEFLSYMNLGESLVIAGGDAWKEWDQMITARLNQAQNQDGSWSGYHCITGRTFCTSAALLVLMVDRAPVPLTAAAD